MADVLVFDLDDTLFPEHQFVTSGFSAVGHWLEDEQGVTGFAETAAALFDAGQRGNIFNLTLDALEIPYDRPFILKLVEVYRRHEPVISLFEDARWALSHYQDLSLSLGIITDGFLETQRNKIKALAVEKFFDVIVCTDEFGRKCWKPSEFSYRKIMEVIGVDGDQCIYVGDNPQKDFVIARKQGWKTIQICREGGVYSDVVPAEGFAADTRINSLYELAGLV